MKYVEFYKPQNDGKQKIVAVCFLSENGQIECSGDAVLVANLRKDGIKDYSIFNGRSADLLFFKDGLKFLEQLRFNFTSGYLNASDVKEK